MLRCSGVLPLALVSKWCPIAKMYDLLPLLWSRSGAPVPRCTIVLLCFGLEVVPQCLRCTTCCRCFGLEVVPQCQDLRFVTVAVVSKWCPNAKMYALLPLLWSRGGAPMLNVRFVAVALASKWCPNAKIYDLLPLLWSRSGAPVPRCTICCRCFGFQVVHQC